MTPERLRQVEDIFSRVIELDPAERERALASSCAGDDSLRAEVESLLKHAEPAEPFLASPALGANFTLGPGLKSDDDLAGKIIGAYRVLRRIASGGMGTVCLASRADGQFEQHVAIKVVKRGMDSEDILLRFAQERRTLAGLNHPHIARLLDGGMTPEGRPYLVMEYVQGVPITQYCDTHRLPTAARLRLFCQVCDAVRFAHQKLVVHRDLKPGNMLVDETGVPKLLDFGISKVLEGTGTANVTAMHERRFTPEYASPEQVAGQPLGTASDIYSLGVILYELLTGQRPYTFESRSTAEIERVVCTREPLAPSTVVEQTPSRTPAASVDVEKLSQVREGSPQRLRRRLTGDLDMIVLKAMHKDPARRYASVDQFVADVERHLDGLPVLARPDTLPYRLRKYARRHAVGLGLATMVVVALVGGAGLALWQARSVRLQRDAAYLARDQAEATTEFLQRMLSSVDPANEGPDAKVLTVLHEASSRAESDLRGQPLVQASVRSTIGRTYLGLGMLDLAARHIQAAHETRRALLEPGHHDLAESEFDLARLLYERGSFEEAETLLKSCLATHLRLRGTENLDTARVWNDLGAVHRAAGKIAEAEEAHRTALSIREKLAGRRSLDVAESLNNLVAVLRAKGDLAEAETVMREVLDTRRELLRPEHPLVIQGIANLAVIIVARGRLEEGEKLLRQAVDLDRTVFGAAHPALAVDLSGLARVLALQKRFAEAEPLAREALQIRRERLAPGDERLLRTQVTLAECLIELGRDSEAEPLLSEVIERALPADNADAALWRDAADRLISIYERSGRAAEQQRLRALVADRQKRR